MLNSSLCKKNLKPNYAECYRVKNVACSLKKKWDSSNTVEYYNILNEIGSEHENMLYFTEVSLVISRQTI